MNDSKNNQTENEKKGLKKFWEKRSPKNKFYLILLGLFLFALCFIVLYIILGLKYSILFSDIARNLWLLFFAIFGGGLAVWGRKTTQTQLQLTEKQLQLTAKQSEHTEDQLEKSAEINRNDRFAKAVEMLSSDKNKISSRGGLHILRDLIEEKTEVEYVRCIDVVSYWLLQNRGTIAKDDLLDKALEIFSMHFLNIDLERIAYDYSFSTDKDFWPQLGGANFYNANFTFIYLPRANLKYAALQGANLLITNLEHANLQGVKLEGADLTRVNMKCAKNLTKEQILSARWLNELRYDVEGEPPELPDDLMEDPDVQEWLKNPSEI